MFLNVTNSKQKIFKSQNEHIYRKKYPDLTIIKESLNWQLLSHTPLSESTTQKWRRTGIDTTSLRRIDARTTAPRCHAPAGWNCCISTFPLFDTDSSNSPYIVYIVNSWVSTNLDLRTTHYLFYWQVFDCAKNIYFCQYTTKNTRKNARLAAYIPALSEWQNRIFHFFFFPNYLKEYYTITMHVTELSV